MTASGYDHESDSANGMSGLEDASRVTLDPAIPMEERLTYLTGALGDPNHFRVGEMGVTLAFAEGAPPLEKVLTDLMTRQKNGL